MATKLKPKKAKEPPETVQITAQSFELWEIVLRILDEQPISTRRRPYLQMICDEINSRYDNDLYHVMTMNDVCYIITKPEKG